MTTATSHVHETHEAFDSATEVLKHEHRVIERVLAVVEGLAEKPGMGSKEAWEKAVDFIRNFADKCHHLKEEQLLFPAMEEHGIPRDGGPIGMMLAEHEEGRAYVRSMFDVVEQVAKGNAAAAKSLLSGARAYLDLLREHIRKEDDILFRMADEVLPPDEQKRIVERFELHESGEMELGAHERY